MWAGGEGGVTGTRVAGSTCMSGHACVCVSTCVCAQECVHLWEDIYIYIYISVYMCISKAALHAYETAASLCCGVSQRVQPNEPARQS